MNRIDAHFSRLRATGRKAFVPYITAGDPTLARTRQLILALADAGADVIELGVPFSDPLADGKTNQASAERALLQHVTLAQVIALVADVRTAVSTPIVFYSYANLLCQYGFAKFARDAAAAGVDGVLVLDMPPEESAELHAALQAERLHMIFLVAPTSTPERIRMICARAGGFIYYVSRTGVTGERSDVAVDLREHIALIRACTTLPIAVGFGISTPAQVAEIAAVADGVVVGSALVRRIGEGGDTDAMVADVGALARALCAPLAAGAA
jgi:tryptophan synthase alpha chain